MLLIFIALKRLSRRQSGSDRQYAGNAQSKTELEENKAGTDFICNS